MEEKKKSKIPVWACLLILILIAGCAGLGYMWYTQKTEVDKKKDEICNLEKNLDTLEEKVVTLEDEIEESKTKENTTNNTEEKTTETNNNTNSTSNEINVVGTYSGIIDGRDEFEGKVNLHLCENGSYFYNNVPGTEAGSEGYYIVKKDEIVLYQILICANDPGRTIQEEKIALKINDDNTISDNELNVKLNKESDSVPYEVNITENLKSALDNGFLQ